METSAVAGDQDQQWLLNCLSATLDPNQEVRSFAEASLNQASLQPVLLYTIVNDFDLSKVLLQKYLLAVMHLPVISLLEGEESFELPAVSSEEKVVIVGCRSIVVILFSTSYYGPYLDYNILLTPLCVKPLLHYQEVIRKLLLSSLNDTHRKICTAISMAVASIAAYDWPEDWPDLLPFLLKLITDQSNMNGVHGGLRCLALLSADLDDAIVPKLVPVLFPVLHMIVSFPENMSKPLVAVVGFQHPYRVVLSKIMGLFVHGGIRYVRTKALSIVYSCTAMLGVMSGVCKTEMFALMMPMLKPWMNQFSIILEHPVQPEDPDDWGVKMEVLKCLNQFIQNFPSLAESEFLGEVFLVYTRSSIEGTEDPYAGRYDSDGAEKSLDSFVIQLFEFLLTIVGSAKLVIASNVRELVYHTIAFLQMTEQQIHIWSIDANQFLADEDESTYSCRVSGALLLEEVVSYCGREGIDAIIDAASKRFNESQQEKAAGSTVWWRMREATLFALAFLSEQLLEAEVSGLTSVRLGELLEQMITEDIGTGVHQYPFLYARIFASVARFSSAISDGVLEHFLSAAITTIAMDVPPPVKVGACRALSELLPKANKGNFQPQMMGLFSSLADLLHQARDETLHLVLETLQAAIKAGFLTASMEPMISPLILNIWALHVSDPFISIDAIEVLEAIKCSPGCIHQLASRILPYVGPILNNVWLPQQQPDGLVAGSLDLLTMLLKAICDAIVQSASTDVVKAAYDVCFDAVIRIILQSEDHSEMQNATECLATFISGGRQLMLVWGGDSGFTMRSLLDAASRLLNPDLESSGSLFVGSYILQLILHLPSQMAQHIRDLVAALVRRLQSAQIAGLRSSLLLIFARLVHMSAPNVEWFINMLMTIPSEAYGIIELFVFHCKTGEIQGAYPIKVTTTALALLLSTRHPELAKINVQGITTRAKAKLAPDQWTVLPLPAKILTLLADALIEIQEQVLGDDDEEDSDWEEVQEGDVESDKDLIYSTGAASLGRPTYEHLEAMAKVYNEGDDYEDDILCVSDPLNEINLAKYLADFFMKFSQTDRQLFDTLCQAWKLNVDSHFHFKMQSLTQAQQNAIRMVLNC
ncbi:Importin N-terminal domain-containing protein [Citrus sinensis]|uniref:Importin N-terminal domain-containing protein n=1 Tax=Citrus sinensis TaxID=2711 RepID=A0ACB8LFE3_CITSI|nr:Importin N-terminal domain-containing protein [Citrus sinensis]